MVGFALAGELQSALSLLGFRPSPELSEMGIDFDFVCGRDMFQRSNEAGLHAVLYFLLVRVDPGNAQVCDARTAGMDTEMLFPIG